MIKTFASHTPAENTKYFAFSTVRACREWMVVELGASCCFPNHIFHMMYFKQEQIARFESLTKYMINGVNLLLMRCFIINSHAILLHTCLFMHGNCCVFHRWRDQHRKLVDVKCKKRKPYTHRYHVAVPTRKINFHIFNNHRQTTAGTVWKQKPSSELNV